MPPTSSNSEYEISLSYYEKYIPKAKRLYNNYHKKIISIEV
jgi:hypothetical protein